LHKSFTIIGAGIVGLAIAESFKFFIKIILTFSIKKNIIIDNRIKYIQGE